MKFLPGVKPGDIIVFVISILLTLGSFLYAATGGEGPPRVEIEGPSGRFIYSLEKDHTLEIPGALGNSLVHFGPGGAQFLESPCTNKLCIHQGLQDSPGDWTACLPNKIFIRITGTPEKGAPDAATY